MEIIRATKGKDYQEKPLKGLGGRHGLLRFRRASGLIICDSIVQPGCGAEQAPRKRGGALSPKSAPRKFKRELK